MRHTACSRVVKRLWIQCRSSGRRRPLRVQPVCHHHHSFSRRPPPLWMSLTETESSRHATTTTSLGSPPPSSHCRSRAPTLLSTRMFTPLRSATSFHSSRSPVPCLSAAAPVRSVAAASQCLQSPSPFHATQSVTCRRRSRSYSRTSITDRRTDSVSRRRHATSRTTVLSVLD